MRRVDYLIVGAGLTGLSVGYHTRGKSFLICEKNPYPGGLCLTSRQNGFLFDCCAHFLHFKGDYVKRLITDELGVELNSFRREAFVQLYGRLFRYPIQHHLCGLDRKLLLDCLLGVINANFNPVYPLYYSAQNFHDWLYRNFGSGLCRHFMVPYNEKFWRYPLKGMSADWVRGIISVPSVEQVIDGALGDSEDRYGYNTVFWYPQSGGIGVLAQRLAEKIGPERIVYSGGLSKILPEEKIAVLENGEKVGYDFLVYTAPLLEVRKYIDALPADVSESLAGLKFLSICNVNLGLERPLEDKTRHWVYYPENDPAYFRAAFPHTYVPYSVPAGGGSVCLEGSYIEQNGLPDTDLARRMKADCRTAGAEVLAEEVNHVKYAYVIFDAAHARNTQTVKDYLRSQNVICCGRYGGWGYMSMEDSILDGQRTVELLNVLSAQSRL